jgi:hypothetical protein
MATELTLEMLKAMPPNFTFETGEKVYLINEVTHELLWIRWVAQRGGIHDWAIYYVHGTYDKLDEWPFSKIKTNGMKSYDSTLIRELVPCTDEAFDWYRMR